jgi:bifunctional enzyme CysN/CysC
VVTAGSVDDGKSTLIGRLLHDSRRVFDDHLAKLETDSARIGSAGGAIDFSLLLDGLKAEREQGITIDVAYRSFSTERRRFIIADCPGHVQYTRNLATGASTANLAVILLDATQGVLEQTKRHSFIVSLLRVNHIVIAVNKMDLVDYSQDVFDEIRRDYVDFARRLDMPSVHFLPMSALHGDNVVARGANMDWYQGVPLLEYLETVHVASDRNLIDMRLPVQLVVRPEMGFRGYAGTLASGVLRAGHEVVHLPTGLKTRVESIVTYDGELEEAHAPMAVTVTLADEIDISRGDMIVPPENLPRMATELEAHLVWMSDEPMRTDRSYLIKHTTNVVPAEIARLYHQINVNTLHRQEADTLSLNEIGRVRISLTRPVCFDPYARNRSTGSFIVIDPVSNGTVGAGMILDRRTAADADDASGQRRTKRRGSTISGEERARALGHPAATIWLTGLPRSGKTTLAYALERHLFDAGCVTHVLDGENLRLGISDNLGFRARDRSENARRAAHVARLCNDTGIISIVALVSPYAADRAVARSLVGPDRFLEVHLSAPVEACEARDDEGLYARARANEIEQFTGVSAPYERPTDPDLDVATHELTVEESLSKILELLRKRKVLR